MFRSFVPALSLFLLTALSATAGTLRGTVTDPDGRPVPGARVVLRGALATLAETTTNAEGRFEATAPDGQYDLRVVLDGFTADPLTIQAGASSPEVTVRLRVSALTESVVVSAAQTDLPLSQSASSITVISGSDIAARQLRVAGDALAFVPGLSVARNGSPGTTTSVFTRGGESDFTMVLLDGVRVNFFGGGADLSQIPLVDVERVEVVRGPQSAVFGSDAIGGVIQIVSKRRTRDRVDAFLEGGSLGTMRARAGASGGRSGWFWNGAADRWQSDGFTGTAAATLTQVSNDNGDASHVAVGGGFSRGGREVRGQAQFSRTDRGFPGPFGSNPIGAYTAIDTISRSANTRNQVSGDWSEPFGSGGRFRQRTTVAVADFDADFLSRFGASESGTRRVSLRSQTDAALSSTVGLTAGFETLRERGTSTYITGTAGTAIPVDRRVTGYFGEARLTPATNVSIAAGVRVEQIRRDALDADPFGFQPRPAFAGETITSVNPKMSVAYRIPGASDGSETRLRASAGTGIRPPDAFEIAFTDNAALKPERSRSLDAGIQQSLVGGRVAIDGAVFFNTYDDLIVAVGRSFRNASQFRTDNISNARARGVELGGSIRPDVHLDVRATYTFLSTEILSVDRAAGQVPSPYKAGEALIRRPRQQGTLAATYARARVSAFSQATFRGQVRDVEPSFGAFGGVFTAAGYGVVDLGASVRVVRGMELFGRVENVGDRRYESAYGFPAPGSLAFVGVRLAASR